MDETRTAMREAAEDIYFGQVVLIWALMYGLLMLAGATMSKPPAERVEPTFGQFLVDLDRRQVLEVELRTRDNSAHVKATRDRDYTVGYPPDWSRELVDQLRRADVRFDVAPSGPGPLDWVIRLAATI